MCMARPVVGSRGGWTSSGAPHIHNVSNVSRRCSATSSLSSLPGQPQYAGGSGSAIRGAMGQPDAIGSRRMSFAADRTGPHLSATGCCATYEKTR